MSKICGRKSDSVAVEYLHMSMDIPKSNDRFFQKRKHNPSLAGPIAIVSTLAILLIVRSLVIQFAVVQTMGPGRSVRFLLGPVAFIAYLRHLIFPFIVWGCYATVFYILSIPFAETGSFRQTFILIGWGFFPRILNEILLTGFVIFVVNRVDDPSYATTPYEYLVQIQYHPLLSIPIAIGVVLTVWGLPDLIWTYAIKHSRGVSTQQAAAIVSIPVGVSLILSIGEILSLLNL